MGAGTGQTIPVLARWGDVDAVEISSVGREHLIANPHVRRLYEQPIPFAIPQRYDVITALDVIEHLADDAEAVRWIHDSLLPGGLFVCAAPAYQWMFSPHDVALGHYRRYTAGRVSSLLRDRAFDVRAAGYFNMTLFPLAVLSRIAWSLRTRAGEGQERKQSSHLPGFADRMFFGVLSREAALIGRGARLPYGLSVITVGMKR